MPRVYVFSSQTRTNIWAGVGAKLWAVSASNEPSHLRRARAQSVSVGALGLIYSVEDKALTTPFVFLSVPDAERSEAGIWSEQWEFPFRIHPLGNPRSIYPIDMARTELELLAEVRQKGLWQNKLHIPGTMVFNPVELTNDDWAKVIMNLAIDPIA